VKGFSKIALPLNRLLTKDVPFKWTNDCQNAFDKLKQALTTTPVLSYPDFNKPFILSSDASNMAIGYVLSQIGDDEKEHVIAYGGRALNSAEKAYSVTEQEMLALISAVTHFRVYLLNNHFTVYTDHKALTWLTTIKHTNNRLIRWVLKLQEYSFDVKHRPGIKHQNSDALSRKQYPETSESPQDFEICEVTFFYENENENHIIQIHENGVAAESHSQFDASNQNTIMEKKKNCPYFQQMYLYLKNGELPENSKRAKAILYEANQYELVHDVLYHIFQPRSKTQAKTKNLIKQIAVPTSLRQDVMKSYHDSLAGGCHLGVQRTYLAIKEKYFWPGMYQNVYDYVTSCDVCQRVKRETRARNALLVSLPIEDTFQRWHVDILAGLPKTKQGYQYILLVTDSLSHWSEALPMKTQEATEVAQLLYKEIFTRYGAPRTLVSDRGQNFMSNVVQALCKIFQVTRHVTSSYHPQSNAACERINSTLAQSLREYCQKHQDIWEEILPSVMMAFRMSPCNQSTGYSPFYMLYGEEMNLPLDIALMPKEHLEKAPKEYIDDNDTKSQNNS
jgi:hypothetical protein